MWASTRNKQQQRPFNGLWSGTTRVGRYQKKHSPIHTHPDQCASFITFLHLQWSMASSLFNLRARQSSRTTSYQVFGLPLGLEPSISYSIHFFTQSSSFFSQHMTVPVQPVLLQYQCYVIYPYTVWASTRKVKPIWILVKQETVSGVASAGSYATVHLAPDKQAH